MVAKVSIDGVLLEQLQTSGELRVENTHGVPIVLMTVDAREQLGRATYDDSEWSADEMMSVVSQKLNDPEGWGHPDMDDYDNTYGHLFDDDHGKDQ